MSLFSERNAAYGVIAIVIMLGLVTVWPSASSATLPAQAAVPIIIAATPNPAWTPRPVPAPRDQPPAFVAQPTPTPVPPAGDAPVAAADSVSATVAEPPQAQIVYAPDGSATLAGVDGPYVARDVPYVAPLTSADAVLYQNLPVAGEPPAGGGRPLMIKSHGGR